MSAAPLAPAEQARLRAWRAQLQAALQAHDRTALQAARQQVLAALYGRPVPGPALRQALCTLAWQMCAWRVARRPRW